MNQSIGDSPARAAIDLSRSGRSSGYIVVESNLDDRNEFRVPIYLFKNGRGPTVLFTGAIHGDEYEGPIALTKIVRTIDINCVQGRIIIIPFLNVPAVHAAVRCSPLDGKDLNRSFPGHPDGSTSEVLAHLVATTIVPEADIVIDLHTGGGKGMWIPCAMMHPLKNSAEHLRTLDLIKAMRAPAGVIIDESDKPGMFDTYVESLGKPFVCCEFGGGILGIESLAVAEAVVRNALNHAGIVKSTPQIPAWKGRRETRLLEVPHVNYAVAAPISGIYEPLHDLGDTVTVGTALGRIYSIDYPETDPTIVSASQDGLVFQRRAAAKIEAGQRAAMIARVLA